MILILVLFNGIVSPSVAFVVNPVQQFWKKKNRSENIIKAVFTKNLFVVVVVYESHTVLVCMCQGRDCIVGKFSIVRKVILGTFLCPQSVFDPPQSTAQPLCCARTTK